METKVVVITGASEGLGKSVATKLAMDGSAVILVAHNQNKVR